MGDAGRWSSGEEECIGMGDSKGCEVVFLDQRCITEYRFGEKLDSRLCRSKHIRCRGMPVRHLPYLEQDHTDSSKCRVAPHGNN